MAMDEEEEEEDIGIEEEEKAPLFIRELTRPINDNTKKSTV
jgi:hypothetical protein